jgi:magnesium chelatase family protein
MHYVMAAKGTCCVSLAVVHSRANIGIEAPLITVEVHLSAGLPGFTLVGLPETVVKESRERVRSALLHCGLEFPQRRLTINLAPADLPKTGGRFDLAIAIGILVADGQLDCTALQDFEFMGELSLAGDVRRVQGVLPGLIVGSALGKRCIVPAANEDEAALLDGNNISLCSHLLQLLAYLKGELELAKPARRYEDQNAFGIDMADVAGQAAAKRALLLAAAGGHNLLMRGPPGTGKTMLASRLVTILPPLSPEQAMELAAIRSISGKQVSLATLYQPPFRTPHHTSSAIALTGGGSTLHTGEISLAHQGVLFLDELPEFSQRVLEVLREPMEAGHVQIARAKYQVRLPARFQLLAAMNPCPCGYHGDPERECRCTPDRIRQYQQRISGPLLDRIDIQLEVPRLSEHERRSLLQKQKRQETCSSVLRDQVELCRALQLRERGCINARLEQQALQEHCPLAGKDRKLFNDAARKLKLSTRACFRVLRIARTIADLAQSKQIKTAHLLEAINYRRFDTNIL